MVPIYVIYSAVGSNPAGFPHLWLQGMLRAHFSFNGVISNDDLSMKGTGIAGTVVDDTQAALATGCDMALIYDAPEKADQLPGEFDVSMGKTSQRHVYRLFGGRTVKDWVKP